MVDVATEVLDIAAEVLGGGVKIKTDVLGILYTHALSHGVASKVIAMAMTFLIVLARGGRFLWSQKIIT